MLQRFKQPVLHGLLVALGFGIAWYGPSVIEWFNQPRTKRQVMLTEALRGLGYNSGYQPRTTKSGVRVHRERSSWNGYNLYVSEHAPAAFLMDMEGNVLHRWSRRWSEVFTDERTDTLVGDPDNLDEWREVHLYPNGDLLALYSGHGMVMLDRESNLLWSRPNRAHHDVWIDESGEIYVPTLKPTVFQMGRNPTRRLGIDDVIRVYDRTGRLKRQYSLLGAFRDSRYEGLLNFGKNHHQEFFHTNSVQVLPGGHLLLSLRRLNAIVRLDTATRTITWALVGRTVKQHNARRLPGGHLTVFDNGWIRHQSRVLEIDPETRRIVWQYGTDNEHHFYTKCCGSAQRLPNGNTLITVTNEGRAFEVTRDGEVVWDFFSPHRIKDDGTRMAQLYRVYRYPHEIAEDWLDTTSDGTARGS